GSVSYRPGTETSFAGQSYETKFVPVTGSLMLFLPIDGFSPYGLAGIGAYYTIYDSEGPLSDDWESQFDFGYHLGFGAELALSDDVALSLDYRYIFLTPEGENAPEDADFSGNLFTLGLMFYL
ncbi:MAG TPA: outer membrane beta-barrel protein, partial [Balneolaceae bacterium]|nr:outer membrane beta-barrel protein [Balneolaceae bacterium]